jgi:hypothetical protein
MSDTTCSYKVPQFRSQVITDYLRDGYWLEAPDIDLDSRPDLIGYGIALGDIYWYQNPDWTSHLVASKIKLPAGMDVGDITGNGYPDMVICYQLYGPGGTIYDPNPEGARVDWIENPGNAVNTELRWNRHYIGSTVGIHRVSVGHFTQTQRLEVLGLPIVALEDVHALVPVVLFTQPDDIFHAPQWPMTIIDDSTFRMIHGVGKKRGLIPGSDRDSVLLASDAGVTWLYYDEGTQHWHKVPIGVGELTQVEKTSFKGSGDVDAGRIGNDPFAYVAAIEPFHGNTVAVYCKESDGLASEVRWSRVLLDVYGDPNERGEGPGHCVMCRDFDGDGDDEFLIGLRGPWPWQGVMYYKAIDIRKGVFAKWRVSNESVARIAVADFSGRGKLDFATIAYAVPRYYVAKDAKIMLYHNEIEVH